MIATLTVVGDELTARCAAHRWGVEVTRCVHAGDGETVNTELEASVVSDQVLWAWFRATGVKPGALINWTGSS